MIKFDAKDWDIKKVNLNQDIINDLFAQGLLDQGTNYFPNPGIGTSPLVDQALASYYQSLQ